jgi:hypothetical protein
MIVPPPQLERSESTPQAAHGHRLRPISSKTKYATHDGLNRLSNSIVRTGEVSMPPSIAR